MDVISQAGGPVHPVHAAVSRPELCPHTNIAAGGDNGDSSGGEAFQSFIYRHVSTKLFEAPCYYKALQTTLG